MRPIARLLCWLDRHAPRHGQVSWNGAQYCGTCTHCDRPIRRIRRGNWRSAG